MNSDHLHTANLLKHIFTYGGPSSGLLLLIFLLLPIKLNATGIITAEKIDPIVSYDEVPVTFTVNGSISFEADVIITESNRVYVNIEDLFKNIGVYCQAENGGDQLTGFIVNKSKPYSIDIATKQISIENRTIQSENGIVKLLGSIYVESTVIADAFGLTMIFNYRTLSIKLESNFELPLLKQMRLEQMRQNISKLQDTEIVADTLIKRNYHLFKFGMLDWALASYQGASVPSNNRIDLGVGAELLYGQANVAVYYDDLYPFTNRNLYYNWRWVDNDKKYIKQAQLGNIYPESISFLRAPVVGARFTNSPNNVRKASGYHIINEHTAPNWTVELYINDILVDYTVADASGLYIFKVPIVYGYTILKLRFYGPMGEERIEERVLNVPFTFVPAKTLEYSISGGELEDRANSKFGQGVVNYGINRFITVGGGLEYLSSIPNKPLIPFASFAVQPFSQFVLNFEYAYDVRMKTLMSYNFGRSAFIEIDYENYTEGQLAVPFKANEERKARVTLPFKMDKISGYAKLNFNQYIYTAFNYNQFDAVISGYYKNYSANISTLLNWIGDQPAYVTSNLSLSYRMNSGLVFRPSIEYNVSENQVLRYRAEIEKSVAKMYFSTSYERNVVTKNDNAFISFRYDLNFARTGFSSAYSNNRFSFAENAQGSLAFGADNGVVRTGNNSSLGKGGILFYPFLDLNQNGKLDKGEQRVLLSHVKVTGGQAVISAKDSIVRVSDLNAFINYNVTFSDDDLNSISWRFTHKTYQVLVDPNQYKRVEVPIVSVGEVSGIVRKNNEGVGRITIQFFDKNGNKVAETLTERDGYFNYLGLRTGEYNVRVDETQLEKLGYQSTPKKHQAFIKASVDGIIIQGLDFVLTDGKDPIISEVITDSIPTIKAEKGKVEVNETKKPSKEISAAAATKQSVKKPGDGTLDILSRYSKVANGKIYGQVYNQQETGINGIRDIAVHLYNFDDIKVGEVASNDKGIYGFTDVLPGKYQVRLNAKQLEKLGLQSRPKIHNAVVITSVEGDIIENLDFEIDTPEKIRKDSVDQKVSNNSLPAANPEKREANKFSKERNDFEAPISRHFGKISDIAGSFYGVQIGVFRKSVSPKQLLNLTPVFYEILPDRTARYIFGNFDLLKTAKIARNNIIFRGIKDAYVVAYQNGKKIDRIKLDRLKKYSQANNGKIEGRVEMIDNGTRRGLEGISVQLWNAEGVKVSEILTGGAGNFSFSGFKQGKYTVRLDDLQLEKSGYQSTPKTQNAAVKTVVDGDLIQSLEFVLTRNKDQK